MCGCVCMVTNVTRGTFLKLTLSVLMGLTEMAIPLPGITASGLHC